MSGIPPRGDPGPSTMSAGLDVPLPFAPRVSQVDADDLDESLVSMLSERVTRSLGNFNVRLLSVYQKTKSLYAS